MPPDISLTPPKKVVDKKNVLEQYRTFVRYMNNDLRERIVRASVNMRVKGRLLMMILVPTHFQFREEFFLYIKGNPNRFISPFFH